MIRPHTSVADNANEIKIKRKRRRKTSRKQNLCVFRKRGKGR